MPMPPPNPTTDGRSDPQTRHEVDQLARALRTVGTSSIEDLQTLVGARFWDDGRFEKALAVGLAEGVLRRVSGGSIAAS
ncbi:hypothetical protein [Nocardioides currus]|uniref:Uncharacterized protein n=1 Tax=Nocardioides currus TaxID=2133958 RepID=A0A2R7YYG7_9ACTN|nr:hypothetical protein [Nocardioides currus]PUA81413.1 hypothetical protein C7S10_10405 [Nocardioides currus]